MNTKITLLAMALMLGIGGCTEGTVEDFDPAGTAPIEDDVQEGGPEEEPGLETPREAAVPEWQERERGEVADGDQ